MSIDFSAPKSKNSKSKKKAFSSLYQREKTTLAYDLKYIDKSFSPINPLHLILSKY
jgi:hypothetical protein